MLAAVEQINLERKRRGEPPMRTGLGIHVGSLVGGGLVTADRVYYTIIGDTVNITQRVESLARDQLKESGILISQAVLDTLGESADEYHCIPMGEYVITGKSTRANLFRLLPPESNAS
jgi:adenylate cyclase